MAVDATQVRRAAVGLMSTLVRNRTVILTGPAAHSQPMARLFTDAGAHPVSVDLNVAQSETRTRFAEYERTLTEPEQNTWLDFDAVDPDRTAIAYAGSFTAVHQTCSRHVIGARSAESFSVERKDKQHRLIGLTSRIISLADGLPAADGAVVVQGIPDDGVAMATSHTYLIPHPADVHMLAKIDRELQRDCRLAMADAFDVGAPCTFYGFITAETVIDIGPVEALVYWNRTTWRIHAPGILRPMLIQPDVLDAARVEVHRIGHRLHHETGYVGAFGTDGVIVGHHYVVHDVNPRVCTGFSQLDQLTATVMPLAAIDLVLREVPTAASAMLSEPLMTLASAINADGRGAAQMWDEKHPLLQEHSNQHDLAEWSRRVRCRAAHPDLVEITQI